MEPVTSPADNDRLISSKEARVMCESELGIGRTTYFEQVRPRIHFTWLGQRKVGGQTRGAMCRVSEKHVRAVITAFKEAATLA